MASISNLENQLNEVLDAYKTEIDFILETSESNDAAKYDIEQVAKQVFYTFNDFKNCIVKYLKTL